MRYKTVVRHSESKSLFYVVDKEADEGEQPCVVKTCHSWEEAQEHIKSLCGDRKLLGVRGAPNDASKL